jgi:hypothetical protein
MTVPRRGRQHGFQRAADGTCALPTGGHRAARAGARCGLPRDALVHVRYPCGVCGLVQWSIDSRLRHIEQDHRYSSQVWERA